MADFNRKISSQIYIFNAKSLQTSSLPRVKFDNDKFNSLFRVYSDDLQNAMYILTPALLEKISNLEKHFGKAINLSFIYEKLYICIETVKDNFEPDLYKSAITDNPAFKILRDLNALIDLAKILDLTNIK